MEANRKEVDPSGQELIEGSTIAGEISSVNHTAPCPSAPPIEEGRYKLIHDQKRARKREADRKYREKKKSLAETPHVPPDEMGFLQSLAGTPHVPPDEIALEDQNQSVKPPMNEDLK